MDRKKPAVGGDVSARDHANRTLARKRLALGIGLVWLAACAGAATASGRPPERNPTQIAPSGATRAGRVMTESLSTMVRLALEDAARRRPSQAANLTATFAEPVTWPDGSLGCPQPGKSYVQVLVAGFLIRIAAGAETLEYHAAARGVPHFCDAARAKPPASADPRI